jgi:hypothetical protein
MRSLGPKRLFTLMLWVVCLASQLSILAFAGDEQDLQTKTPMPRQIEAQPTSASSQPPSVVSATPSVHAPSTGEQTGEGQAANTSPNDNVPKNSDEPRRRALPAPLDGVFPSSEYLGPTPLIGVPDTDPIYPLTRALWSAFPALKRARIKVYGWANAGINASTSDKSNSPSLTLPFLIGLSSIRAYYDSNVFRTPCKPTTLTGDSASPRCMAWIIAGRQPKGG